MRRENIPTPNPSRHIVIMIHHNDRCVNSVFGSTNLNEVYEKLGFCKSLYAELDYIEFRVMQGRVYDKLEDIMVRGGEEIYDAICK
jgi:hypothetical protein